VVVGKVLVRLRRESTLEQAELARRVGVTQSTWSRIENGASSLSLEQLADAAASFGRSPGEVLRTADELAANLEREGITVLRRRNPDPLGSGFALVAGAVIVGVLVALVNKGR